MLPRGRHCLAVGLAALWLAGCTPPDAPAEPAAAPSSAPAAAASAVAPTEAAAPTALTVCHSSVSSTQSVPEYAQEQGLFAKEGLDVDLVLVDGGTKAATALVAGDVGLCQLSGSAAINAIAAGAPLKIVAGLYN